MPEPVELEPEPVDVEPEPVDADPEPVEALPVPDEFVEVDGAPPFAEDVDVEEELFPLPDDIEPEEAPPPPAVDEVVIDDVDVELPFEPVDPFGFPAALVVSSSMSLPDTSL